jgi:hypothetical protein
MRGASARPAPALACAALVALAGCFVDRAPAGGGTGGGTSTGSTGAPTSSGGPDASTTGAPPGSESGGATSSETGATTGTSTGDGTTTGSDTADDTLASEVVTDPEAYAECVAEAKVDPCQTCTCDNCLSQWQGCREDPGCQEIRVCAQANMCTGLDCLGPCGEVINMNGGIGGQSSFLALELSACFNDLCEDC